MTRSAPPDRIDPRPTPEVANALADGKPVVALESTILCHGMPYPENVETALAVESAVRESGAVPATIAVVGGRLRAGLAADEIERLGRRGSDVAKVSRRDLPLVVAGGSDGATTVAATMFIAERVGVKVFATGGIGGVHRDVNETMDVSADLTELGRTSVAVVCAGIKSVLDIGRTLEYLETLGVPVIGYRTDELPAFYTRKSGFPVDARAEVPADIAAIMHAKWQLGLAGGIVVGNPVPAAESLDKASIDSIIGKALEDLKRKGLRGKQTTPYLLASIAEKTGGESLRTNIALVRANATLAATIAAEYAALVGAAGRPF